MGSIRDGVKDGFGSAGSLKYGYQAARAAKGLSTTTKLTAALDIVGGGAAAATASGATDAIKGASTLTKGATGATSLSGLGKVASVASKAAPVVAKGSAVLGAALGGVEIGTGINKVIEGKTAEGRDKIISGTADVITAGALGVAATSSGTVVGLPVAAVALGVAGVSQAGKYAYKYRHEIASGAKWVGNKVADGASWLGSKIASGYRSVRDGIGGAMVNAERSIYNMYGAPYF